MKGAYILPSECRTNRKMFPRKESPLLELVVCCGVLKFEYLTGHKAIHTTCVEDGLTQVSCMSATVLLRRHISQTNS